MKPRHFPILAVLVFAGLIHAQPLAYNIGMVLPQQNAENPLPPTFQGLPSNFARNNDGVTPQPLAFQDSVTGNIIYVESDGRHVSAISPGGKILWTRDPFADAHLQPYRFRRPIIIWVGRFWFGLGKNREQKLGITFNSSQFGTLDDMTGDFQFCGQD